METRIFRSLYYLIILKKNRKLFGHSSYDYIISFLELKIKRFRIISFLLITAAYNYNFYFKK